MIKIKINKIDNIDDILIFKYQISNIGIIINVVSLPLVTDE